MMKLAMIALLTGSAAAFAPAQVGRAATSMDAKAAKSVSPFAGELGTIDPTGFFDPLGLSDGIDQATFDRYRTVELKHGRVAQLAVLGFIIPEVTRFPGDIAPGLAFADVPNGYAALDAIPSLGWLQIVFLIGAVDYWGVLGDFEVGKLDLSAEKLQERKLQELQHGRLAMIASLELIRHTAVNGADGLDHVITGLPFIYD
jgi:hypothetical protein